MKDAPESQRTCSDRDDQCRKEFFECLGLEILAPGWSSVAMGAGEAAGPYFGAKAYQHAAARNLSVPMRSSIVRRHLSISRRISPITALASIILAEGICLAREIKCLDGR
jgi:hypothetical protein